MKVGKISANVIQHSRHAISNKDMISLEIEIPRIILAELNTHKIMIRNSQSTRAVPIKDAIKQIEENMFMPKYWGKNQSGMVAKEECNSEIDPKSFPGHENSTYEYLITREATWKDSASSAIKYAMAYNNAGYHKQICGRLLEPFSMIKLVFTATEWDNFFNLRIHPDAEPHFRELAIKCYIAIKNSKPIVIKNGEWHLPYIDRIRDGNGVLRYYVNQKEINLETARDISLSCIAQTSYRKHDTTEEKAETIISKLFGSDPVHASPAESVATPMINPTGFIPFEGTLPFECPQYWEDGVTHITRDGNKWSGQLKHFIQYRQLIPNNVCNDFTHDKFIEYTMDLPMERIFE